MTRNVLLPACHLLKSCDSTIWLDQREAAQELLNNPASTFPRDYHLNEPVSDYLEGAIQCAFLRDETIAYLTAPQDKHKSAQAFIQSVCGDKKPLTVTLREAAHDSSERRKIDIVEWERFFKQLDLKLYQPIIVRDTANAFSNDNIFSGYPQAPVASIDVLFRTALYENSYINFFVNNGPYVCALYTKCNSIVFKYSNEDVYATSRKFLKASLGLAYGDQRPITEKRTIIAWEDDTAENIKEYFNFTVNQIESGIDLSEQHNINTGEQTLNTINIAINYVFTKLKRSVHEEDIKVLKRIQDMTDILSEEPTWNFNLQDTIIEHEGGILPTGSLEKIRALEEKLQLGLRL
ncbi:MAG: hypothetical protein V3T17_13630 [Pseudomonadales bacterium]